MTNLCALCNKPATGFATINDKRYCNGDESPQPTCYEIVQRFTEVLG